jgi:hypothetical protein
VQVQKTKGHCRKTRLVEADCELRSGHLEFEMAFETPCISRHLDT